VAALSRPTASLSPRQTTRSASEPPARHEHQHTGEYRADAIAESSRQLANQPARRQSRGSGGAGFERATEAVLPLMMSVVASLLVGTSRVRPRRGALGVRDGPVAHTRTRLLADRRDRQ
jgi:hypothetical protein